MSELGPEARAILDAGRAGDDPTTADRARNRAALMRAIAAGGAVGAAAAASEGAAAAGATKLAGALSLGWKLLAGVVVVGAVSAGAVWSRDRAEAPAPVIASAAVPAPAEIPPAPPAAEVPPATPPSAEPVAPPPRVAATPAPRRPEPVPVAPAPVEEKPIAPDPPEDTLPAETKRLREAHGALQGGDPARALALLDEQTAAGAQLGQEREAARVLALCQLGRVDEAKAAAARFLRDNPRSPLADRVRAACAAASPR